MPPRLRHRPQGTVTIPLGALGVLAMLSPPGQGLARADTWVSERVLRRRSPALIGLARMVSLLGVHWPTDALAGGLFAQGWLALWLSGER